MDEDESPFCINVAAVSARHPVNHGTVRDAVQRTLSHCGCPGADISVALVDDARIEQLNRDYLDHDGPTDCITFNLADHPDQPVEGEIVVSVDTAHREAARRDHALQAEVLLYTIHGTLHLLGMDDATPEQADRMHAIEDEVLTDMGFGPVYRRAAS